MTHSPLAWIGLGGVPPDDNARAVDWQRRLHWPMVIVALLSVPAYLLSTAEIGEGWHSVAAVLDYVILAAFVGEMVWMVHVSSYPWRYFFENWLNVVIVVGAATAAFGSSTEWIALVRGMRAAVAVLVVVRTTAEFRFLFTRKGAPMLIGVAFLTMLGLGALFYWLDPRIQTFGDGLWLAFITGATVGYGDVVPTTGATRIVAVLTVMIGVALMTLFTANVVSFFIGGEENRLRGEIAMLLDAEELRITLELHKEIRDLRREVADLSAQIRALPPVLDADEEV